MDEAGRVRLALRTLRMHDLVLSARLFCDQRFLPIKCLGEWIAGDGLLGSHLLLPEVLGHLRRHRLRVLAVHVRYFQLLFGYFSLKVRGLARVEAHWLLTAASLLEPPLVAHQHPLRQVRLIPDKAIGHDLLASMRKGNNRYGRLVHFGIQVVDRDASILVIVLTQRLLVLVPLRSLHHLLMRPYPILLLDEAFGPELVLRISWILVQQS